MKKILFHSCCAPCTSIVLDWLSTTSFQSGFFFYNPNIHPYVEYRVRYACFQQFMQTRQLVHFFEDSYDLHFMEELPRPLRCEQCYEKRLRRVAGMAVQEGYDAFSTTLLVSPYQFHDKIRGLGLDLASELGIDFFYQDFRPLFKNNRKNAECFGLYRQQYCGCVYSEFERFREEEEKTKSIRMVENILTKFNKPE